MTLMAISSCSVVVQAHRAVSSRRPGGRRRPGGEKRQPRRRRTADWQAGGLVLLRRDLRRDAVGVESTIGHWPTGRQASARRKGPRPAEAQSRARPTDCLTPTVQRRPGSEESIQLLTWNCRIRPVNPTSGVEDLHVVSITVRIGARVVLHDMVSGTGFMSALHKRRLTHCRAGRTLFTPAERFPCRKLDRCWPVAPPPPRPVARRVGHQPVACQSIRPPRCRPLHRHPPFFPPDVSSS